ncbi:Zinc finger matrin-type protein 5 [Bonamia ostreae]|uniref:Zinc finger matrin-type protein 5 n=1 Tax=Bonamia ostreae TaxID=126728 RepID=A0ABV2AN14_9EUKA
MGTEYYFCDYCYTKFPSTTKNRKQHFSSKNHKERRKKWYNQFLTEQDIKLIEQAFVRPQQCPKNTKNNCDDPYCLFRHGERYSIKEQVRKMWLIRQLQNSPNLAEWKPVLKFGQLPKKFIEFCRNVENEEILAILGRFDIEHFINSFFY